MATNKWRLHYQLFRIEVNQEVLHKCLQNDRAAQKQLYHSHKQRLMSLIYRYTMDITTAQDLLQETFILIFRKLDKYDAAKGSFESWTSRIAINKFLEMKRKKNELSCGVEVEEHLLAYESVVIDTMTLKELRLVISKLPEVHRVILNLFYFEDYDHKEIGELLNIAPSSSRSRLTRARKLLESYWNNLNVSRAL